MFKPFVKLSALTATLFAVSGVLSSAEASFVSMQTRYSTSGALGSASAYQSYVDGLTAVAPTPGYCDAAPVLYDNLSTHGTCGGPSGNTAFHFRVNFTTLTTGAFDFRLGVDFGFGGAVFVDGVAVDFKSNDMWWNGSYGDSSQAFVEHINTLSAGHHVIDVYGLEGCCDGGQQGQFLNASGVWTTFGSADGMGIPEPTSLGLLGMGAVALAARRRRVR